MPNQIESQIKDRIAAFVAELDTMVRRSTLEALQSVLANGAAPARRGRPAGAKRGPGRPRGARSSADLEGASQAIVAHVQANDGQGISEIAASAGVPLKVAKKAAIQLLASGQLKKSGVRRGTRYHVGSGRPAPKAKAGKRGKRKVRRSPQARKAKVAKRSSKKAMKIQLPQRTAAGAKGRGRSLAAARAAKPSVREPQAEVAVVV